MAKKSKKKKIPLGDTGGSGFGNSMADLLKQSGLVNKDAQVPQEPEESTQEDLPERDFTKIKKVVIRHETKGRGGKTVTSLTGLPFSKEQLKQTAKEMRKSLGCGAGLEEDRVVLQGDQVIRAHKWLEEKGVPNIVLGTRPKKK